MLPDQKVDIDLSDEVFILSPFDILNVFRHRLKDFFDFDYQIECFVPTAKRQFGKKKLLNEFSISPAGMKLYVRSRRVRNVTMTLSIAGAVGTLITNTSKNRENLRGRTH